MAATLDHIRAQRYEHHMSDDLQDTPRRLGRTHAVAMIVWFVLTSWLLVAMIASVFDAVFYGDGPLKVGQLQEAGDVSPQALTHPTP